jgi:hypothetical protein
MQTWRAVLNDEVIAEEETLEVIISKVWGQGCTFYSPGINHPRRKGQL